MKLKDIEIYKVYACGRSSFGQPDMVIPLDLGGWYEVYGYRHEYRKDTGPRPGAGIAVAKRRLTRYEPAESWYPDVVQPNQIVMLWEDFEREDAERQKRKRERLKQEEAARARNKSTALRIAECFERADMKGHVYADESTLQVSLQDTRHMEKLAEIIDKGTALVTSGRWQ